MIAVSPSTLSPDAGVASSWPPVGPVKAVERVRVACPDARPPAYQAAVACAVPECSTAS